MDFDLQIGKYTVKQMLGKGATGTVYLAVDTFSGAEVALKTIEPEVFADPEFGSIYRSQFLNEASLAGKLKHPHIVAILDAVVGEDSGHIAMEYVPGGDLSEHVRVDKMLSVEDVVQVGFKCCWALDYAFREGIVHRDIKPANIMFVGGTEVKIADFGAALLRKTQVVQTANIGSPYYMSPEQLSGKELTLHSDMYCLGVVLYELLTGQRPFSAGNMDDLIKKILNDTPVPPSKLRPSLSPSIDKIVLQALGKRPEHRYPTWADFAADLSAVAQFMSPSQTVPDSEKFIALKRVAMLNTLSDAETWELVKAGNWTRVEPGQILITEDQPGQSFFFLAQGQVKVTQKGRLLNLVDHGECVGEMAYIRGGEMMRQATVSTITKCTVAEFEPDALSRMSVGAQLHFTRALASNLVDRLALANSRIK
jgi:serine/threonine protein kinase